MLFVRRRSRRLPRNAAQPASGSIVASSRLHNTCITSGRHAKVLSGTPANSVSAGQRPDLGDLLALTRRRSGVRDPQRPPRQPSARSTVGAVLRAKLCVAGALSAMPTATTSHGSKRPFRLTVRGSQTATEPPRPGLSPSSPGLVSLRERPDPGSRVDAFPAPVWTFLGGFGSVESDPHCR